MPLSTKAEMVHGFSVCEMSKTVEGVLFIISSILFQGDAAEDLIVSIVKCRSGITSSHWARINN